MTHDEARDALVSYWLESAREALESARSELKAERYRFAVNRAYYACFYAASAVLLRKGSRFVKHSGVREALHRDMVNTGRLDKEFGRTYDRLFIARHEADYGELVKYDSPKTSYEIEQAGRFVEQMRRLLGTA